MSYRVKLNIFEGPLDLLVYLIEHAGMSIYDIEISEIITQYLKYIGRMEEADIALSAEFMALAAELLEIKSRMLLPRAVPEDAKGAIYEDPRTELVEKLREYKKFKAVSEMLGERRERAALTLEKPQEDLAAFTGEADEYLCLDIRQFKAAFEAFLHRKRALEEIREHNRRTEKEKLTAGIRMAEIRDFFRVRKLREADFIDLVPRRDSRYEILLTFASLLEMIREHALEAEQEELFGNIRVRAAERLFEENGKG